MFLVFLRLPHSTLSVLVRAGWQIPVAPMCQMQCDARAVQLCSYVKLVPAVGCHHIDHISWVNRPEETHMRNCFSANGPWFLPPLKGKRWGCDCCAQIICWFSQTHKSWPPTFPFWCSSGLLSNKLFLPLPEWGQFVRLRVQRLRFLNVVACSRSHPCRHSYCKFHPTVNCLHLDSHNHETWCYLHNPMRFKFGCSEPTRIWSVLLLLFLATSILYPQSYLVQRWTRLLLKHYIITVHLRK